MKEGILKRVASDLLVLNEIKIRIIILMDDSFINQLFYWLTIINVLHNRHRGHSLVKDCKIVSFTQRLWPKSNEVVQYTVYVTSVYNLLKWRNNLCSGIKANCRFRLFLTRICMGANWWNGIQSVTHMSSAENYEGFSDI